MSVLILAEHDNQRLTQATYHAVSAALLLSTTFDILILGSHCQSVAEEAARLPAIQKVRVADAPIYEHLLAENAAEFLAEEGRSYQYILAASSTFSKNIIPRTAALLDVSMISDVIQILSPDTFVRPLCAGNVYATVQSLETIKVLTIRSTAFPLPSSAASASVPIEKIERVIVNSHAQFETQQLTSKERPELTSARIVVAGGRGLKSAENFKLLEALADRLGAAIGASRAAVDAGYVPNDYQVGQTGKMVAPDLYIAVGISGAIQHVAGMKDSKVIVAINNDPDAPIFQYADYIIVGDLFKILPEIQNALDK